MLIAISALRNVVIAICDYDSIVILRWRVGTPIAYITECKADHFGIQWNLEGVRNFRFVPGCNSALQAGLPQHRTNHQLACIADYQSSRQ